MADSFILGLSTGSACLLTCGLVMFPYFMSGSAGVRKMIGDISLFLLTRLILYFILATIAYYFGKALLISNSLKNLVPGSLYVIFAVMLVFYSIRRNREKKCPARVPVNIRDQRLVPVMLGIVNTLGFCPALFLFLTEGASQETITASWAGVLAFFAGSSLWFLPVPLAGKIKKREILETIGILATGLAGIIYLIKGLTRLAGGFIYG